MWYKIFLPKLHEIVKPNNYLEIGIRHGYSLSLSPLAKKIAIDPSYGESDDSLVKTNTVCLCNNDAHIKKKIGIA